MEYGKKILIAEDDINLRHVYVAKFRQNGYDTMSAPTAADCLLAVRRRGPDVAIIDLDLVLGDDTRLLREIARLDGRLPILLNTAGSDREVDPPPIDTTGMLVYRVSAMPQMLRLIRWLTSADSPVRRRIAGPQHTTRIAAAV